MFASVLAFSGDAMAGAIHDGGGKFTVRDVKSAGPSISNLGKADALLAGGGSSEMTADYSFINFSDPEKGSVGHFGSNSDFPNNSGADDDDFAIHAQGAINITSRGFVTFGVHSDDGSRLIIDGKIVINDDNTHGGADRFGTIRLKAGFHMVDYVFFERGGGAHVELFIATVNGTFTAFGQATYELLEAAIAPASENEKKFKSCVCHLNSKGQNVWDLVTSATAPESVCGDASGVRTCDGVSSFADTVLCNDEGEKLALGTGSGKKHALHGDEIFTVSTDVNATTQCQFGRKGE